MTRKLFVSFGCAAAVVAMASMVPPSAEGQAASATKRPASASAGKWIPPRTPWGDPDLQGNFTNKAELGTPLERSREFEGRRIEDITGAELAAIVRKRQEDVLEDAQPGGDAVPHAPLHWSDRFDITRGGRPWQIIDPPDGKVPPMTAEGQKRARAAPRGFDSWVDRTMWERCITRGLPGSMIPNILGNSYKIVQSPGYVAIVYEMIHETRVIPLDGRPHANPAIRLYMGDARGRWDGDTLVVETTHFTDKPGIGQNGGAPNRTDAMRIVERFTRVAPDKVMWAVTIDDPKTWTKPWTFALPLTVDDSEPVYEFACHEGNLGMRNILSGARAEEKASKK